MVTVREEYPQMKTGQIDLSRWLVQRRYALSVPALPMLEHACSIVETFNHDLAYTTLNPIRIGVEMVNILTKLRLDQSSLVAAFLYRLVHDHRISLELVRCQFGAEISNLVSGVLKMGSITTISEDYQSFFDMNKDFKQLEQIRKMIVSMVDDVRVALIKISEITCMLRLVKMNHESEKNSIAREALFIYAPLVHRLGIGFIKWELEDIAFRYLNPEAYKYIAKLIHERRIDREHKLQHKIIYLQKHFKKIKMHAEIQGRVKSIYSIWRKMKFKKLKFHELYDIQAVRVLVGQVPDCYAVLNRIHDLWPCIDSEFDDYIENPKVNGYQSLHTTVLSMDNTPLEVQIRTYKMHEDAELGACSHWVYKGTDINNALNSYEKKLNSLRQVLDWHEEFKNCDLHNLEQWCAEISPDCIYVFTHKGEILELPLGSTPLQFATTLYGVLGSFCHAATIGGKSVPLTYPLKTGDRVDVMIQSGSPLIQNTLILKQEKTSST